MSELFLGIDVSTQGVKTVAIDPARGVIAGESAVNFGKDLPEFGAPNGFIPTADPLLRHADPAMWAAGMDLALERLRESGVAMEAIGAISGSGQQHGTVYLAEPVKAGGRYRLSRPTSPIWMDRTTEAQCRALAARFGDRLRLSTGSNATERFSGPQIRRFAETEPEAYRNTAAIALVSSFLCSLLIGRTAPVDEGDGGGMNLLDLRQRAWDTEIAEFTAPGLLAKLPPVAAAFEVAGNLDLRYAKFGLRPGIPVVVWTGDNPASLVGVGATEPGTAVVSLGTSDTFFGSIAEFFTDPDGCGHVFGNGAGNFMSLVCFTNGSLAREAVRQRAGVSYAVFDRVEAPRRGELLLPYFEPESTPPVLTAGIRANFDWEHAEPGALIRALLESQALSMKLHSRWQGEFRAIRVTGGAARSEGMRRILCDVFNAPVATSPVLNSAALGAAFRAAAARGFHVEELGATFCRAVDPIEPDPLKQNYYQETLAAYRELERQVWHGRG